MNRNQRIVVLGATALFFITGLFPPWTDEFGGPRGYGIIAIELVEGRSTSLLIDFKRLLYQWFILVVVSTVLYFVLRTHNSE